MPSDPVLVSGFMVMLGVLKCCVVNRVADWVAGGRGLGGLRRIKFQISTWKFVYFTALMVYGLCVVTREDWVFDQEKYNRAYREVPQRFKVYCLASLAFYMNELIGIFIEPRKKDFWEMLIHHVTTIALIWLSYMNGLVRYGCSTILIHDVSDPSLELAKINVALKNTKTANVLFFVFMVVFISTRIFVYPLLLVLPATYYLLRPRMQAWSLAIVVLLNVLVVAHVVWSYMILRMFYRIVYEHKTKDVRSEEDGP